MIHALRTSCRLVGFIAAVPLFLTSASMGMAAPPFEYKADRPGSTTFLEFRRIHKSIFDKYPPRNVANDIKHNLYDTNFEIICDRPVKDGEYVAGLNYCETAEQTYTSRDVVWDFMDGVLAFVNVYFPSADYADTLGLLEAKYGAPTSSSASEVHIDGGPALPYVQKTWKSGRRSLVLRSVSETNAYKASLAISDEPMHRRFLSLSSNASI